MKSNKMKRILVAILCMVVVLSSNISVLVEGKSISKVEISAGENVDNNPYNQLGNDLKETTNKVVEKAYSYDGEEPDLSLGVYPERYKIWRDETNREHSNEGEQNRYTFGDFGESYDIFNILARYNAFTFDSYEGTHIVGPVAAGGNVKVSIGGTTPKGGTTPYVVYPHTVPSYIGGSAQNGDTIKTESNIPLFINGNIEGNQKKRYMEESGAVYCNYYYTNDNYKYIDMEMAKAKITQQMQELKDFQGIDVTGHYMKKIAITDKDIEEMKSLPKGGVVEKEGYTLEHTDLTDYSYGVRLKLGYNFEISSVKDIDYIIYDYESLHEVGDMTTFISILDAGEFTMPAIFKSVSDKLGTLEAIIGYGNIKPAYQFASTEVEEAFNIVGFFPNATKITVVGGVKKYVGHLVAPKAHVQIVTGDYNGTMIANSITSGAEGHMWPFNVKSLFEFRKTVNGSIPNENEVFKFKIENISKPETAENIPIQYAENTINGLVTFDLSGLTKRGEYIFKISEEYTNTQYIKNDNVYYAKFNVLPSTSTVGGVNMSAKLEGFYEDEKCTIKHDMNGSNVLYNNFRDLKVQKKWTDTEGNELDKQYWKPVSVEIHRKAVKDEAFQPTEDTVVDNVDINEFKNNTLVETVTLSQENDWKQTLIGEQYFSSKILDEDGKIVKYDFSYYAKEVDVPSNATVSYENNDGIIIGSIIVKNQVDSVDLTIQKKSSTGNNDYLSGAEFKLYKSSDLNTPLKFTLNNGYYVFDENGDKETLLTDGSETGKDSVGLLKVKELPFGDYVIQETKHPEGFVINSQFIFIHVDSKGSYYQLMGDEKVPNETMEKVNINHTSTDSSIKLEFAVENTPNIEVPETGGKPNDIYKKIGLLLTCLGFVMFTVYEVKFNKNRKKIGF
ncbi:MAG: collagen-binding domain-containing protein [Clostridium sp.]|uniref:collagen-binding domain-containing protein n=1 Tax=Clostridium sp. TaxID=1506 RepID=UPI0029079591|nr:collagen-binding domain-containing protein [Clostridium sp.]MDU4938233.1 collagen-binding domain-containing protein [Clostridium sp.]